MSWNQSKECRENLLPKKSVTILIQVQPKVVALWEQDAAIVAELENQVYSRVRELFTDLAFPDAFDFELEIESEASLPEYRLFQVVIDGQVCRQKLLEYHQNDYKGSVLGNDIAETVIENRELLVSDEFLESLRKNKFKNGLKHLDSKSEQNYISHLVRHLTREGYSLSTIDEFIAELHDEQDISAAVNGLITPDDLVPRPWELKICLAPTIVEKITGRENLAEHQFTANLIPEMCDEIFFDLGLEPPPIQLRADPGLNERECRLLINDIRSSVHRLIAKEHIVVTADAALRMGIDAKSTHLRHPTSGESMVILENAAQAKFFEKNEFTTYDYYYFLKLAVEALIRRTPQLLLTNTAVDYALGKLNQAFPMLTFSIIETIGTSKLGGILRELIKEGVSVRDLRLIMDAVLSVNGGGRIEEPGFHVILPDTARLVARSKPEISKDYTTDEYADYVRREMRDQISQTIAEYNSLQIYPISQKYEKKLHNLSHQDLSRPVLPEKQHEALIKEIYSKVGWNTRGKALVASVYTRRILRSLIDIEFPHLPVITYQEIADFIQVQKLEELHL